MLELELELQLGYRMEETKELCLLMIFLIPVRPERVDSDKDLRPNL